MFLVKKIRKLYLIWLVVGAALLQYWIITTLSCMLFHLMERRQSRSINGGPTKILLVGLMRGGSSMLARAIQLEDEKDTVLFFEPYDAMYSHLYKAGYGWHPLDIHFFTNGTVRLKSDVEKVAIVEMTRNIFSCNTDHLPVEWIAHRFVAGSRLTMPWLNEYRDCLQKQALDQWNLNLTIPDFHLPDLLTFENNQPRTLSSEICYKFGTAKKYFSIQMLASEQLNVPSNQSNGKWTEIASLRPMNEQFADCFSKYSWLASKCSQLMRTSCERSHVRVIKSVRLDMETVEILLKSIPDIRVVYLVRDPRGISISRRRCALSSNLMKGKFLQKEFWTEEAKFLCKRMLEDYKHYLQMRKRHPNSVHLIRYEQFAANVRVGTQRLGLKLGLKLKDPLAISNDAELHELEEYRTSRANPLETAYAWKKFFNDKTRPLQTYCNEAIREMGYELL